MRNVNLCQEVSCKHILEGLGQLQRLGQVGTCPRCGYRPMSPDFLLNALSRHADVYICNSCGMEEAMLAAAREPAIPFKDWALFQGHEEGGTIKPARDTFVNAVPDVREAQSTKRLYALGLALDQECPENDCRIYKNIFNMARELDGAIDIIGGYPATVLRSKLHERIRELREMWEQNYAILAYRAQHGEERPPEQQAAPDGDGFDPAKGVTVRYPDKEPRLPYRPDDAAKDRRRRQRLQEG